MAIWNTKNMQKVCSSNYCQLAAKRNGNSPPPIKFSEENNYCPLDGFFLFRNSDSTSIPNDLCQNAKQEFEDELEWVIMIIIFTHLFR